MADLSALIAEARRRFDDDSVWRDLVAEAARLTLENERLRGPARQADVDLVGAIHRVLGEIAFVTQQVTGHAALGAALAAAFPDGVTVKRLGKRLAKLNGADLNGLTVHRVGGSDRAGVVWTVGPTLRVCAAPNAQTPWPAAENGDSLAP